MSRPLLDERLLVVVGAGGVGKTTLAAALGLQAARTGHDTLVMTFDPSLRLKDALGVGEDAKERAVRVDTGTKGALSVALLDARSTFDRLIRRYAPDAAAAERIHANRFYRDLAGNLAGILEYMAVERLFEVAAEGRYDRIILDTPPTRQALDFLEAPDRIMAFLDSGAMKVASQPWFEGRSLKRLPMRLAAKSAESLIDRLIGLNLLRDVVEFFNAFGPLFAGFRERAGEVRALLQAEDTLFLVVSGPGAERIPDTLFFARKLQESGHRVGPIVVNQLHPAAAPPPRDGPLADGLALFHFLGARDQDGLARLRSLLGKSDPPVPVPLQATPPTDLAGLEALGRVVLEELGNRQ